METLTREIVFEKVKGVLANSLGVEEKEIMPNSILINDLGAESIDLLDIYFRLDKKFNKIFDIDIDEVFNFTPKLKLRRRRAFRDFTNAENLNKALD